MHPRVVSQRNVVAATLYGLLNPIPFGCFVAALIFDATYAHTGVTLWIKGAAWLILFGLLFAIVPRLVNLVQVWITSRHALWRGARIDFWLNLVAIVVAIVNAFVHTRDAYAAVPAGVWLSVVTVLLLAVAHVLVAVYANHRGVIVHD
ncbi:membrane protein [Luteibacter sp. 9135]|uniref:membrane protein n=1 Tax=Luteibacter sp. 9135 TaxID=1500893 RepID=UPI000568E42E|nr:membrane protein [Luteibacter sp. 9135]